MYSINDWLFQDRETYRRLYNRTKTYSRVVAATTNVTIPIPVDPFCQVHVWSYKICEWFMFREVKKHRCPAAD